jgi:hypothetical protein
LAPQVESAQPGQTLKANRINTDTAGAIAQKNHIVSVVRPKSVFDWACNERFVDRGRPPGLKETQLGLGISANAVAGRRQSP